MLHEGAMQTLDHNDDDDNENDHDHGHDDGPENRPTQGTYSMGIGSVRGGEATRRVARQHPATVMGPKYCPVEMTQFLYHTRFDGRRSAPGSEFCKVNVSVRWCIESMVLPSPFGAALLTPIASEG